jgi:hypothetical protein
MLFYGLILKTGLHFYDLEGSEWCGIKLLAVSFMCSSLVKSHSLLVEVSHDEH